MSNSYVELLCKSNFSFLTGASHPQELVARAQELGLSGLALADSNGMYGIVKGFQAAKTQSSLLYLVGAALSFQDHSEIVVLVKSRRGYGQLCQLLTQALSQEKGVSQLSFADLEKWASMKPEVLLLPRDPLVANVSELREMFAGHLYFPIVRYLDGMDRERTQKLFSISRSLEVPMVASNDVYYHVKERKNLQDVLISIREGVPIKKAGYKLFSNAERYLKSPQEMKELFRDIPEALENTLRVSEQCHFSLRELRYYYPSEWIPQGHTAQSYLELLVWQRLPRVTQKTTAMESQLRHELRLVEQLHFADYFLTVVDLVDFARSQNILCQGRGAAANSALCYVLGITAIDPVRSGLLFERFLSVERGEPPDIDVDFEHERREEVIQYIYNKYGRDRAAMVSAVITYRHRSALREVCKAFDLPVGTLSAKKVEKNFVDLLAQAEGEDLQEKIEVLSSELTGFPRHISIHSGGFTLSADAITQIVPVEPARMDGRTIIQWDKYDLDELGLLKVDILALGMLSALRKTLEQVGMKLSEIPPEDSATYKMIQRADTVGTFQIESRAQMSMLGRLQPENFYDLVIEVALVRPGPIVGEMVHPYLKRRRGIEKVIFPNEKVHRILGRTLGIPLFQEQVMRLAIELADFTPGEADQLRRAIGAWRSNGSIQQVASRLREGLLRNGMTPDFTEKIFHQIRGFSEYGFPESHAASFALLAYASCYLKCHYPTEFVCGLLNSQPMGFYRTDTLIYDALRHGVQFLPVSLNHSQWDSFINESRCVQLGFRIVRGLSRQQGEALIRERRQGGFYKDLPDILKRTALRRDVLRRMILADQWSAMKGARGTTENSRYPSPRYILWTLLEYENFIEKELGDNGDSSEGKSKENPHIQLSLFNYNPQNRNFGFVNEEDSEKSEPYEKPEKMEEDLFTREDAFVSIQRDYEAYQISTHGHPMLALRQQYPHLQTRTSSSKDIRNLALHNNAKFDYKVDRGPTEGDADACSLKVAQGDRPSNEAIRSHRSWYKVCISGMLIVRQRPPTAGGTSFATLEDEFGFVDLIIPSRVYQACHFTLVHECFVTVTGNLQRDRQTQSVIVRTIVPLLPSIQKQSLHSLEI